jgi:Protein of unknown function (DUF3592)
LPNAPTISRSLTWQLRIMQAGMLVLFFGGSWFMLSYGIPMQRLAIASKTWPTVPGTVMTADVARSTSRTGDVFDPHVTYAYVVDGESYFGQIVRSGGFDYGDRARAEAKLAVYPVGAVVAVRYDPNRPSRSVLESGGGGDSWLLVGAGIAMGGVGVYLLVVTLRDVWGTRHH